MNCLGCHAPPTESSSPRRLPQLPATWGSIARARTEYLPGEPSHVTALEGSSGERADPDRETIGFRAQDRETDRHCRIRLQSRSQHGRTIEWPASHKDPGHCARKPETSSKAIDSHHPPHGWRRDLRKRTLWHRRARTPRKNPARFQHRSDIAATATAAANLPLMRQALFFGESGANVACHDSARSTSLQQWRTKWKTGRKKS